MKHAAFLLTMLAGTTLALTAFIAQDPIAGAASLPFIVAAWFLSR